jgi:hypothetical protein
MALRNVFRSSSQSYVPGFGIMPVLPFTPLSLSGNAVLAATVKFKSHRLKHIQAAITKLRIQAPIYKLPRPEPKNRKTLLLQSWKCAIDAKLKIKQWLYRVLRLAR